MASYRRGGTGSKPPLPNGLHRKTLRAASAVPTIAPRVRIASPAYREHPGLNRHWPPPNAPDRATR